MRQSINFKKVLSAGLGVGWGVGIFSSFAGWLCVRIYAPANVLKIAWCVGGIFGCAGMGRKFRIRGAYNDPGVCQVAGKKPKPKVELTASLLTKHMVG